jgi:hypothetical protein
MSGDLMVLVRIGLYVLGGRLLGAGLPPELVEIITNDPAFADLVGQVIGAVVVLVTALWWRIAKRLGWAT